MAASDQPLSIIIVGVGDADFSSMQNLDGDDAPLYSAALRKHVSRDIVQFVPFNEFKHDPMKLAKATLGELPRQLTDYFQGRKINPLPAMEEQRKAM